MSTGNPKFSHSLNEGTEKFQEKYEDSRHYWENGRLGSVYQTYVDANTLLDELDLSESQKIIENMKVLEARKRAFGCDYKHYPPWNSR